MSKIRAVWLAFVATMFYEVPVFHANSVEIDQTPRYTASDLGLRCLLNMSLLWDARFKWVNHHEKHIFIILTPLNATFI